MFLFNNRIDDYSQKQKIKEAKAKNITRPRKKIY